VVLLANMMIESECPQNYWELYPLDQKQKELNRENIFPFLDKKTIQKGGFWWTLLL
jgi:hypothetical protein